MSDEVRMTDYVVLVHWENTDATPTVGMSDWPPALWREAGVVSVPQRTNRKTVVEQAKQIVGAMLGESDPTVVIRVFPLAEMTEADVSRVVEPVLSVTIRGPEQLELAAD